MEHATTDRAATALASKRAEVLIEALPWIKELTGKTVVVKYGGAAMVDETLRQAVVSDIVLMKLIGMNPVIVHGGGNDITRLCNQLGIPVEWKNGMRVTDDATMEVVKMTLIGKVNQELVSTLNAHGHLAVGLSGGDAGILKASPLDPELGWVGRISACDTTLLEDLLSNDYIPVVASVAVGEDGGAYNVNADAVAGALAAALGAHKVLFLTDVDGLYEDFSNKASLISRMTHEEARALADSGTLSKGMIPKIDAICTALEAGVPSAAILNGTFEHVMLIELFTDAGIGTMVTGTTKEEYVEFPLTNLASKIITQEGR